jgi:hypothetical protein
MLSPSHTPTALGSVESEKEAAGPAKGKFGCVVVGNPAHDVSNGSGRPPDNSEP